MTRCGRFLTHDGLMIGENCFPAGPALEGEGSTQDGAEPIEKLVRSAVANAGNNHDMNADELYIARITVDGGPGGRFTKRVDPRAQGRAYFKRKRLSHVTVIVSETPPAKPRKKTAGASVQAARITRRAAPAAASAAKSPRKKSAARKRAASAKGA